MTARPTLFFLTALALTVATPSFGAHQGPPQAAKLLGDETPKELAGIGIKEQLGVDMNQDLAVMDETGKAANLKDYFFTGKPTSFSLVYYNCSGLCNLHLNGLFDAFKEQRWKPGKDFTMIAMSFDPKETPEMASAKKQNYMTQYQIPAEDARGIHFLTAEAAVIGKVTKDLGFTYQWLEDQKEWAHASAAILVTPKGIVSRYLHGVYFDPKTLEMSMAEVSQGKLGSVVEQFIWKCFKWDHQQGKYTLFSTRLMQLGGIAIILLLSVILVPYLRTIRREV